MKEKNKIENTLTQDNRQAYASIKSGHKLEKKITRDNR